MSVSVFSSSPRSDPSQTRHPKVLLRLGYSLMLLCMVLFVMGCPNPVCKQDSDCKDAKHCKDGKCIPASTEQLGTESSAEATSDGGGERGTIPEPPPFGDSTWKESTLSPPETLQENQPLPTQGNRKTGETCNPLTTALPVDRCKKENVCVPTSEGVIGLCLKACDPKNTGSCGTTMRCMAISSPDFRNEVGYACVPTVGTGYPCSQAQACTKDNVCMTYRSTHSGICRKACKEKNDCNGQWCYSRSGVQGKPVTGCAPYVQKAGGRCPFQTICGEGLNCYGRTGSRRCLTNCSGGKVCPNTHECREIKSITGKILYSLCLRKVKAGEFCDSTTRCEKGHHCITLASSPLWARCMRDCTKDAKVCGSKEVCNSYSKSTKLCYQEAQEGQRCGGETRCAQGLMCTDTRSHGPKHCMKACKADGDCGAGRKCLALKVGSKPPTVCVTTCDPKAAKPCAQAGYQCVEKLTASPVCVPSSTTWQGKLDIGAKCQPHVISPNTLRCKPSLRCVALVEGWRCLHPCDTKTPNCPTGQSCLWDHQTQATYCGARTTTGKPCDLTKGSLCEKGARCRHLVTTSQGTCIPYITQKQGDYCTGIPLPCAGIDLCSGDPSLPFRWTCRARCSTTGAPTCPASKVCLNTVGATGACFATCPSNKICSNKLERCVDIQTKKVCM